VSIPEVTPFNVGALIALYERAVGFYATLVNINAYHQPGVEAGKKAATADIDLQILVRQCLAESGTMAQSADDVAAHVHADPESVYHVLTHLAANDAAVSVVPGASPAEDRFTLI
jgi:glucose-6-phosphate isomerase